MNTNEALLLQLLKEKYYLDVRTLNLSYNELLTVPAIGKLGADGLKELLDSRGYKLKEG